MAEIGTLARPYAKAAFETALAAGTLNDWSQQLALLAQTVDSAAMRQVFSNPALTPERQATSLIQVCAEMLSVPVQNLLSALAENKRLALLPAIAAQYEVLKLEQEKCVNVVIRSAFPLDGETEARLTLALKKKLARDIQTQVIVDESLIGGIVVRAGDLIIDGSARSHIRRLAAAMNL